MRFFSIPHLLPISMLLTICISCTNISPTEEEEIIKTFFYDSAYTIAGNKHFISGYHPVHPDGDINVVVEIPSGTTEKWEVDKSSGNLKLEFEYNEPRVIHYLGYPCNYGMVPQTLLPVELDGDGDPLDVLILGPPIQRGSVVKCKLIGVLEMMDRGEQDDKLIAVAPNTCFYTFDDIDELMDEYEGVTGILELWFANYKGPGMVEVEGFGNVNKARRLLEIAINAYKSKEE